MLYSFVMKTLDIPLFKVETGPYDVTPPTKGVMNIEQNDIDHLRITHAGFQDFDSAIDHFTVSLASVCLHTGPSFHFEFLSLCDSGRPAMT